MMRTSFNKFTTAVFGCFLVVLGAVSVTSQSSCNVDKDSWCQNLVTAKRCGIVSRCRLDVWNQEKDSAQVCSQAQHFIKKAHAEMMKASSNAAKLNAVAGICSTLDAKSMETCKSVMGEAGFEVLEILNSTLPLSRIGQLLGLCETVVPKVGEENKVCTDCKRFLRDIKDQFIGEKAQNKLKKRMQVLCLQVPSSFNDMCLTLSDTWVKHFFMYLNETIKEEKLCDFLIWCRLPDQESTFNIMSVGQVFTGMLSPLSDVTCKTCVQVMNDFRNFIDTESFQDEFEDMISGMCTLLPEHLRMACHKRIDRYGDIIFDLIIAGFDSHVTCEAVRMCPESGHLKASFKTQVKKSFTKFMTEVLKDITPNMDISPMLNLLGGSLGNTECNLCELVFKEVERTIRDDSTKAQIKTAMNQMCEFLPQPWLNECIGFVKQNGDKLIDDILKSLPPRMICYQFGVCQKPSYKSKRAVDLLVIPEQEIKEQEMHRENKDTHNMPVVESAWCGICEQIADIVKRVLASQELEVAISTIYDQFCNLLPSPLATKCSHISKRMIDGFLGGISTVAVPETICGGLGVCALKLTPMNYTVPVPEVLKPRH